MLVFPKVQYEATKDMTCITGIFRSGTTLLGKLMGSYVNVEYSFEPAIVFHVNSLLVHNKMDEQTATDLLRTFFAEHIMINYHHGRGYNFRRQDDSCIFTIKEEEEVRQRMEGILCVTDAVNLMRELNSRLIVKVPAIYKMPSVLARQFEGFKVVEIRRNLKSVLSSVLVKGWFGDDQIEENNYPLIWPNIMEHGNDAHAPYFLSEVNLKKWKTFNVHERTMFVLIKLTEQALIMQNELEESGQYQLIRYEDLLNDPQTVLNHITSFGHYKESEKTKSLLAAIKSTQRKYDIEQILQQSDPELVNEFITINQKIGYAD